MEKKQVNSSLKTKSGEVIIGEQKVNVRYIGGKEHFDNLVKEIIEWEIYKAGLGKKNDVIVDVGGYIGMTALYFAQFSEKVYVLEPAKASMNLLKENIKKVKTKGEIIPIEYALHDYNGKGEIFSLGKYEKHVGATLIRFNTRRRSWPVKTIRLDTLMEKYGIDHIDLLKMDIEGLEYKVLESEGFEKVADKIDRIILEAHPYGVPGSACGDPYKIHYLLRKYGFKTQIVKDDKISWAVQIKHPDGSSNWKELFVILGKR